MIENSHRICPLGDFYTDRTTCVLPPGWEKRTVWRTIKDTTRLQLGEKLGDQLLLRHDFQLFFHDGKYYLPDSAKSLYLKVPVLWLLVPTLAGFRVVADASFFFGYLGLATYEPISLMEIFS